MPRKNKSDYAQHSPVSPTPPPPPLTVPIETSCDETPKESPVFDIHALSQCNSRRLEQLEKIGDCSELRGQQLDAFLEEFLGFNSTFETQQEDMEKSLDCETRWIPRRH